METTDRTYSGRRRRRSTTPAVKAANVMARVVITIGGLSTILAVTVVCVFLVAVVVPMFLPPAVEPAADGRAAVSWQGDARHLEINEYRTMGWIMDASGEVHLLNLEAGEPLGQYRPFGERTPTAMAFSIRDGHVAAGFQDGSVQYGTVDFATTYLDADQVTADVRESAAQRPTPHDGGMLELTPEGQYRLQTLRLQFEQPSMLESGTPIRLVDVSFKNSGPILAAFSDSGRLHIAEVSRTRNLLTGKVSVQLFGGSMQVPPSADGESVFWLGLAGLGDNAFLAWRGGRLLRIDTRLASEIKLAEDVTLTPEADAALSTVGFLIGKTSLVSGDTAGRIRVWFRVKPEHADTVDGATLVMGHQLPDAGAGITALAASSRSRMVAVGDEDGGLHLYYATNNRKLAQIPESAVDGGVLALKMAPKDDALYALGAEGLLAWRMDVPHPEINLQAIFTKVWYEGYTKPEHVWQSSSGTDDFEPKYGLMPLIFGTIKATVFSMIFAVPIALLAAVYTSEIMSPRLRAKVKPSIEMMASLPSVVLGFLAALVIAPYVEDFVPALLASFATIPFALLLGAHLWQLLPPRPLAAVRRYRLAAITLAGVAGVYLASVVGPVAEHLVFGGDFKAWLADREGSGAGGWLLMMLPATGLAALGAYTRWVLPRWRRFTRQWSRQTFVAAELARNLLVTIAVCLTAWSASWFLADIIGWDPRGGFIDTYVQRNALIVGFVMGFAVIPIIYTLSEDALNSVPEQLRAASLGAGATQWQTAMHIIVPTAASGIFSAIMIGFGRAVGETMIVLMAAGNTPLMEWNIFNGFRTLSANIAVELPEAVRDSTHYRMLFLAALALFVMTFVLNSGAEIVRQRVRKRAYQL